MTLLKEKKFVKEIKNLVRQIPVGNAELKRAIQSFPVFGNSVPKSGTHLLRSALMHIKGLRLGGSLRYIDNFDDDTNETHRKFVASSLEQMKPHLFKVGHLTYNDFIVNKMIEKNIKVVMIVRDPRDIILSHVNHAKKNFGGKYRFYDYYAHVLKNDDERIKTSISGLSGSFAKGSTAYLPDVYGRFEYFLGWKEFEHCLWVKFEDLIGQNGGGDDMLQRETFKKIVDFVGCSMSEGEIDLALQKIFDPSSPTFNKGQIGRWKQQFTDEHIRLFKKHAKNLLVELDYEKNNDW